MSSSMTWMRTLKIPKLVNLRLDGRVQRGNPEVHTKGRRQKKSVEFSTLFKTHPPTTPSVEKNKNNMV